MSRIALVTGAASGIGAATARRLHRDGWQVWAADRDAVGLAELPEGVNRRELDVADEAAVSDLCAELGRTAGRLDAVVACAGVSFTGSLSETSPEQFDRVVSVNLRGVFLLARAAVELMRAAPSASFVAVASELGTVGTPGLSAYGASKAGVINLMRVLALEYAEVGIRFNALAPGGTRTPMMEREQARLGKTIADSADNIPMRRLAEPEEIAAAASFLASSESSYVTGSVLVADGGYTAR